MLNDKILEIKYNPVKIDIMNMLSNIDYIRISNGLSADHITHHLENIIDYILMLERNGGSK